MHLKTIVEQYDTRLGRMFDLSIQLLIVVSLITFSLETLPNLTEGARTTLYSIEVFCIVVFTVEYVLRVLVADRKLKFVTSFFGLVDLLAILPFYLSLGFDLRSIRIVRLIRVFRIFKLARYNRAVRRFRIAILIAREELILFGMVTLIVLYLAAVGIYYFERDAQPEKFASVFHSFWWATTTLTTVGYGDVYPVTLGGRCFTFVVLVVGLGIVAVPTGLLASALSKAREIEDGEKLSESEKGDAPII